MKILSIYVAFLENMNFNFGKLKTHENSCCITNATLKFGTQITLTTERQN